MPFLQRGLWMMTMRQVGSRHSPSHAVKSGGQDTTSARNSVRKGDVYMYLRCFVAVLAFLVWLIPHWASCMWDLLIQWFLYSY